MEQPHRTAYRPNPSAQYGYESERQSQGDPQQRRRSSYPQRFPRSAPNNVATTERQLSVVAGGALVLHALISRSRYSLLTGALGAALIWHGQSERSPFYDALDIDTAHGGREWQRGAYMRGGRAAASQRGAAQRERSLPSNVIEIKRAVTVDKPADELYDYWRKLENLPNFMNHLKEVTQSDETHSHWVAKLAGGLPVAWDAEITEDVPGQRIAWRTTPDAQVEQIGSVEFKPATGERGTVVHVEIRYSPPGGIIGETFAHLLNGVTAQQVKDDIRRFKNLMETGEIPTIEGQPSGR